MDATGKVAGRLATRLALILQGKHKPIFTRFNDCGDYVVVTNARQLFWTGQKLDKKVYYRHTEYPGGLRRTFLKDMMKDSPETALIKAVKGMLPKNRLQAKRLARLKVYPDAEHPYKANIAASYETFPQVIANLRALLKPSQDN